MDSVAFPAAIAQITFNYNSKQSNSSPRLAVQFGTSEITVDGSSADVGWTADETSDVVAAPDAVSTYFRINWSVAGAFYFDSIVISFVA